MRGQKTAIIANGETAYHMGVMLTNWTKDLQLLTNGQPDLNTDQLEALQNNNVPIVEKKIAEILHDNGNVQAILFSDGTEEKLEVIYHKPAFTQHSNLYLQLGCAVNEMGYLNVDMKYKTSVEGVYAAGDNTNMMRSVAGAVAAGNMAGAAINAELIFG